MYGVCLRLGNLPPSLISWLPMYRLTVAAVLFRVECCGRRAENVAEAARDEVGAPAAAGLPRSAARRQVRVRRRSGPLPVAGARTDPVLRWLLRSRGARRSRIRFARKLSPCRRCNAWLPGPRIGVGDHARHEPPLPGVRGARSGVGRRIRENRRDDIRARAGVPGELARIEAVRLVQRELSVSGTGRSRSSARPSPESARGRRRRRTRRGPARSSRRGPRRNRCACSRRFACPVRESSAVIF